MGCRIDLASAEAAELAELADVAARTFPMACPESVSADNISAFVGAQLSAARFAEYVTDPNRTVLIAREAGDRRILGYAMMIHGVPDDPDVQRAVTLRPAVELSKIYVLADSHGGTTSSPLMEAALRRAVELGAHGMWLGVNQENQRAQRFYTKHGFTVSGTKTFTLGTHIESDYVMTRAL